MIEVKGKNGIKAKVIADSINEEGARLTTMEVDFHRFILAEFNTHRMLSRNGSSTRAVPVARMIEVLESNPAVPVHFGRNNAGMQSNEALDGLALQAAEKGWYSAMKDSISHVQVLSDKLGINGHKQWVGRLLEPFTMQRMLVSATDWDNFFTLRLHKDAQPEFYELARCMKEAMGQSKPALLKKGEWHLPYIQQRDGEFFTENEKLDSLSTAIKVSASCSAQISYRKLDTSVEKALQLYEMLVDSYPPHASPIEHQATPILARETVWPAGCTHQTADGFLYSGNFRGWAQWRHLRNF